MRGAEGGRDRWSVAYVGAAGLLADLPVPRDDPGRVGRIAEEVLSRPEFAGGRPSLLDRALEWVFDRIGQLLELIVAAAAGGGVGSILTAVAFLAVVAGVGIVVWRVLRGVTADPAQGAAAETALRPATDWRAEAEVHERAGAWRQALRCRYRALVADLATRGLLDEVPGTTAGEYRGQLRRNAPAAAGDFGGATEMFELARYGNLPTGEAESARFRDLAGRVLRAAGR
jgi:hypothetical protein